jgi:membrane fusion protein (multidrug efflux system)
LMNPTTGTTEFRADFKNPQGLLRSGSSGIIRMPILQSNVIILAQKAVFEIQGKQIVYVVGKGNKVKSRIIETNGTSELNYIVTNGLSTDDVVVIEGASKLKDDEEIVPQVVAN